MTTEGPFLIINDNLVHFRSILRDIVPKQFTNKESVKIMRSLAQEAVDEPDCMTLRSQQHSGEMTFTDGIKGTGNLKGNCKRMEHESARLDTYRMFPEECPARPSNLARAGFFYTGLTDTVECFSCRGQVQDWEYGDTAMGEHKKHFPDCLFVKGTDKQNVPLLENNQKPDLMRKLSRGAQQALSAQMSAERRAKEKEAMLLDDSMSEEKNTDLSSSPHCSSNDTEMSQTTESFSLGNYNKEHERLSSFRNWPRTHPIEPRDLAKAGFFYTNEDDDVQCFACFGKIGQWKPCDVPAVEHKHHFPNCPFVQGLDVGNVSTSTPPVFSPGFQQPMRQSSRPHPTRQQQMAGMELHRQTSGQLRSYLGPLHSTRHPLYTGEGARLQTYKTWPTNLRIAATPNELARAGFFYTGSGDEVKCFYCDGGLKNWESNDEPWTEHAKWFPRCEWLIQQRGPPFVAHIQRSNPPPFGPLSLGHEEPYQRLPPDFNQRSSKQQHPARMSQLRQPSPPPQQLASGTSKETTIEEEKAEALREYREKSSEPEAAVELRSTKPQAASQSLPKPTPLDTKTKQSSVENIMSNPTTQLAIEMGYSENLVRHVTVDHLKKTGKEFDSPDLLLEAIWAAEAAGIDVSIYDTYSEGASATTMGCHDVNDEENLKKAAKKFDSDEPSSSSSLLDLQARKLASLSIHDEPPDDDSIQNIGWAGTTHRQSNSMPPPSTQPFSRSLMDKELQSLQDKQLCKICMDRELNTVFLPCKHLATCEMCASKVTECPMCRQPIQSSMHIYVP